MGRVPGPADGLGVGAVSGRTLAAAEVARSALQTDAAGAEAQKEGRLQALRRCGWRSQLTADREVLNSHLAVVLAAEALCPHLRDTPQAAGYVLEEALQAVASDPEADHAAFAVDVLDRVCRDDAPAAGEKPRAYGERIRNVGGGAVHRTLDAADDATLVIR